MNLAPGKRRTLPYGFRVSESAIKFRWKELEHQRVGQGCEQEKRFSTDRPTGRLSRRAGDAPPGNMVIWRGLSRLTDIELGFVIGTQFVSN
jgi:hypothetical protein